MPNAKVNNNEIKLITTCRPTYVIGGLGLHYIGLQPRDL